MSVMQTITSSLVSDVISDSAKSANSRDKAIIAVGLGVAFIGYMILDEKLRKDHEFRMKKLELASEQLNKAMSLKDLNAIQAAL